MREKQGADREHAWSWLSCVVVSSGSSIGCLACVFLAFMGTKEGNPLRSSDWIVTL